MKIPRPRFTLRWLVFGVVVVALILRVEISAFQWASNLVSEGGAGEEYILHEAVEVFVIANIFLVSVILLFISIGYICYQKVVFSRFF